MHFLTKAMHFLHSAYSDRETGRSLYTIPHDSDIILRRNFCTAATESTLVM